MVGEREIRTQQRVVAFFQAALGYAYLGHWQDRGGKVIAKVLYELDRAAALGSGKTLYDANREVYGLLRYGAKVQPDAGE